MTNEPAFTEEEVSALAEKLGAWAAQLSPREQQLLATVLSAPAAEGDVQGFGLGWDTALARSWPVQGAVWLAGLFTPPPSAPVAPSGSQVGTPTIR